MEQLHTQSVSDEFIQSVSEATRLFDSLSNTVSKKLAAQGHSVSWSVRKPRKFL